MKNRLLLYFITLILIPVFVVSLFYNEIKKEQQEVVTTNETTTQTTTTTTTKKVELLDSDIKIKINKNNEIKELNLEEYIVGVVAGEMPASFEIEALKAQAVASRTYALYKIENFDNVYDVETTTDDQVYITIDEMKTKWGSDFDTYYNKIKEAVLETKNQVMKKDNKVFKSYYFAMSNGYTEDSVAVFGENTSSSVSSPWDNESLNKFEVSTTFTKSDLKTKLNLANDITNIEILSRDKTNRVSKVKVNDKTYTGIEFRHALTLRSADFTIIEENNNYIITTKGYGHGVGMSQYGANGMAKENYKYDEILKYYYQNIEINTL